MFHSRDLRDNESEENLSEQLSRTDISSHKLDEDVTAPHEERALSLKTKRGGRSWIQRNLGEMADLPPDTKSTEQKDQRTFTRKYFTDSSGEQEWQNSFSFRQDISEAKHVNDSKNIRTEVNRVSHQDNQRPKGFGGQDNTRNPINCLMLKTWAEMNDAGQLVLLMFSQQKQLEIFLKQSKVQEDWLVLLVDAVNHAITAQHQKESIKQLLHCLCKTQFLEHLTSYITEKQIGEVTWNEATEFFTSCNHILGEILNKLPQHAKMCITHASALLNNALCIQSIKENKTLIDAVTDISKRAKEVFLAEKEREERSSGEMFRSNNLEKPPENFMDLPVLPSEKDLREDSIPFIRRAKIQGEYDDINHYLDVQFRLMRQDFIFPLRNGIVEFKKSGCMKTFNSSDLRFYFDVHIIGTVCIEGIYHVLHFDVSKFKHISWEHSKRLIFGSLLCLSKDNFETTLFATVVHHDTSNLNKGIIIVNFQTRLDDVFNSTFSDVYVMAETTAYFEAYYHVLEGLKEMVTKLPLQEYIIHCKREISPPCYLLPSGGVCALPIYDVSCLMKFNVNSEVAVLTTVRWPKTEEMCLNESQREAAQVALTKELAIIQGPPGTGKTYVGLKVMQVLLENKSAMAGNDKIGDPILVVCYTNHALDQFLEGVLKFCPNGIVRVGGQSKSEELKKFNLSNLKLSHHAFKRKNYNGLETECRSISRELSDLNKVIESIQTDIKSEMVLKPYMTRIHYDSLSPERTQFLNNKKQIYEWLQASSTTAETMVSMMIKHHLIMLVLKLKVKKPMKYLSAEMNIIHRASFYHHYLKEYKFMLNKKKEHFFNRPGIRVDIRSIESIEDLLIAAHTVILSDQEIGQVLFPEALVQMKKYLLPRHLALGYEKMYPFDGRVVETWLLGLNKDLQSQLDDIEILTNLNKQKKMSFNTFCDDDSFRRAQNDRMVDNDCFKTSKINASLGNVLNNITYVKQRAEALGVRDDILIDDKNEQGKWETKSFSSRQVQQKLKLTKPMTEEKECSIMNIWNLGLEERFALYNLWVERYKLTLSQKIQKLVKNYKSVQERKKEVSNESALLLFSESKIIGMTTSGAARHRAILQNLGCRIIVVEEAAEVLESHIVTSLNKNCKHLILIGDHQQLRPNPNVYQLAKDYGLEISLFERLVKNNVPHVMLKEQHRMRPEISKMIRHIYPDLEDCSSVEGYENIRGVSKNIFFINHKHTESHMEETKSKANIHEAQFLVALCQYLIYQDYEASQITILATYSGQLLEIKKTMKELNFKHHILVTAVDNFQGEENDIILLSLVRSNAESRVGFLKVDNRVCVALSRAKKGLYVIGNFNLLASQSKLWNKITVTANKDQVIGSGLPIICPNHPDFQDNMTSDEDFKKFPEGGCGRPCQYTLQCGHVCARTCHGYDLEHTFYKCQKRCVKSCDIGHPCKLTCYMECEKCMVIVAKHIPNCGHDDQVPCSIPETEANCSQRCSEILGCGHQCSGKCGNCRQREKHYKCLVPKMYKWPCGHTDNVPCHIDPSMNPCSQICGAKLKCGHNCIGKCTECLEGVIHAACGEKCGKRLPCGHACDSFCSIPCLPCTQKCPWQCHHSACFKTQPAPSCGHACQPCTLKCSNNCKHKSCSKRCSENCDTQPCTRKCLQFLSSCKRKCSGICGELCVNGKYKNYLQMSAKSQTLEAARNNCMDEERELAAAPLSDATDSVLEKETVSNKTGKYKNKDTKNGLLLRLPTCFHIFCVDELDKYVCDFEPNGSSYIPCPVCSKPILKCARYEHINKERSRKRETEKAKLRTETSISEKHKSDLENSRRKLDDSSLMSEFHSLCLAEVTNLVELHAVSFKLKCAFVLNSIFSVMKYTGYSRFTELLRSRKSAVLKIQGRLTSQQKEEYKEELSRCFWLVYLSHLDSLNVSRNIKIFQNGKLDSEVKAIIEELNNPQLSSHALARAQLVSENITWRLQGTSDMMNRQYLPNRLVVPNMEQTSRQVMKILRSTDKEMLCDLLENETNVEIPKPEVKLESFTANRGNISDQQIKLLSHILKSSKPPSKEVVRSPGTQTPLQSKNKYCSPDTESQRGSSDKPQQRMHTLKSSQSFSKEVATSSKEVATSSREVVQSSKEVVRSPGTQTPLQSKNKYCSPDTESQRGSSDKPQQRMHTLKSSQSFSKEEVPSSKEVVRSPGTQTPLQSKNKYCSPDTESQRGSSDKPQQRMHTLKSSQSFSKEVATSSKEVATSSREVVQSSKEVARSPGTQTPLQSKNKYCSPDTDSQRGSSDKLQQRRHTLKSSQSFSKEEVPSSKEVVRSPGTQTPLQSKNKYCSPDTESQRGSSDKPQQRMHTLKSSQSFSKDVATSSKEVATSSREVVQSSKEVVRSPGTQTPLQSKNKYCSPDTDSQRGSSDKLQQRRHTLMSSQSFSKEVATSSKEVVHSPRTQTLL